VLGGAGGVALVANRCQVHCWCLYPRNAGS
jgi:hypothetical protein